jgi:short-subunit dehydrogenase
MMDISNKWALITGASSGMGIEYAHMLAKMGMNIVITARRESRLISLKEGI